MHYGSIKDCSNRKCPLVQSVNLHSVLKVLCLILGGVQNFGEIFCPALRIRWQLCYYCSSRAP